MQKLLRVSSKVYSASKWNEGLTDTIIEAGEPGWNYCSSCRCWLVVNVGFCSPRSDKEDVQVRGVWNWGGDGKEFRLVELSTWIVASEWIGWPCTGFLYTDGHVSFQFWAGANTIIWWWNREQVGWFCRAEFAAKTSFYIVLEFFRWGDDEFWLIQFLKLS